MIDRLVFLLEESRYAWVKLIELLMIITMNYVCNDGDEDEDYDDHDCGDSDCYGGDDLDYGS